MRERGKWHSPGDQLIIHFPLKDRIVHDAKLCNGGDLVCGVCRCVGGNVGKYCECNRPGMSTALLNEKCKRYGRGREGERGNTVVID